MPLQFIVWQTHIIYNRPCNIHDIKYISDGNRLEAPTVANGIKPTLVKSSTHKIPATIWGSVNSQEMFCIEKKILIWANNSVKNALMMYVSD